MKRLISVLFIITASVFITSCAGTCGSGSCGYTSYNSSCGLPSCTDNSVIMENSNPCPGTYSCS